MDLELGRNDCYDASRQRDQAAVSIEPPHSLDSITTGSSDQIISKINWKVTVLQILIPTGIISTKEIAILTTDASRTGWGAVLKLGQSELLQAQTWKKPMSFRSSNQRYVRSILQALRKFILQLADKDHLTVQTDNQVAVINQQRKTSVAQLATTMRLIFYEAMQMGLMLHALHIKRVDNRQAGAQNRLEQAGDYQKGTKNLTTILLQLGLTLQEEMFEIMKNLKCRIYYSLTQEVAVAGTGGLQAV
ncbi:MAG: hypothetical protein EZS28_006326 [Streblomastix strix]|uniref:Reverse transcriptase RNase H-like domain-containing protein n=1 Tax=Streblomastix strix TaxID=222440 RepID=A0A5J4WUB5_9EUKA|nr:MAG: hypothetical protein EZS28_006326 [Streblomastix strix]